MAASSRSGVSGKIWALGAAILLVIAVYTGGWFYAASLLKEKTLALLGNQNGNGVSAECSDADYRGYPFRIGLFCSKVAIDDRVNGVAVSVGALRSAAQIYQPSHIVWELDGPAETRTTHGFTASSQWNSLQSSLVTNGGGVDRSSTIVKDLKTSIVSTQTQQVFDVTVGETQAHLRQNGNDLDAAVTMTNTQLATAGLPVALPQFTLAGDVTLTDKAALLEGRDGGSGLYGASGDIRQLGVDLGSGQILSLSGPFSIDQDGLISGKLKLRVDKIAAWRDQLKGNLPQASRTIDTATKMLSALTGGGDSASLDLTLNRGKILVGGFIAIGEIPPI
ncbi:DUF2125 domain-containing protein [Rhizobium sp. SSA_523]|uniref:DUF2125 domain-containing protein n=1 Tax=Rhizobium sp. SSA_523 TaxID=2952477 RepID=UPI002090DD70|nr:DUF2125 domain-containing protein [Rhizobium sp. SSA_523]MCO5733667.1 DUF2125 domain-containing protein [Rhizobium sp. SSA_523]WKC23039.1 DUF2125 domain-containing protein [Rhizobium sp. SSA_523]